MNHILMTQASSWQNSEQDDHDYQCTTSTHSYLKWPFVQLVIANVGSFFADNQPQKPWPLDQGPRIVPRPIQTASDTSSSLSTFFVVAPMSLHSPMSPLLLPPFAAPVVQSTTLARKTNPSPSRFMTGVSLI
ncbi:hypothetical protein DL546_000936 [Coniochaeta pulveracea]|uniref:Uncharacterized protein n=1 Tax=Coniochaeta pulveracea TaxID=177199 RepID=A0A420XWT6_9PEZI|nr:hypothetical protein DL546_000936 [Coniochaeta pulveracea]